MLPNHNFPAPHHRVGSAARIAAFNTSSRISIDRYLSAPLEDEPASVPAINAALQLQSSKKRPSRAGHSRESSYDVQSDGRWTAKAPESTGTSYSAVVESKVPKIPSPERPTTSGTVNMENSWTEQMERFMPGYERNSEVNYRVRAEAEIARIHEKAKELEEQLREYNAERITLEPLSAIVTDEMAYQQMAARPKLAWILGEDVSDAKSIERPKSSGSGLPGTAEITERRGSSDTLVSSIPSRIPRRSKSSGALDEKARQAAVEKRVGGVFNRKPSTRSRFFCTFCLKRFYSRVEWMRHEQTIHMPEELWVCCPRTGEFPDKCPFCSKNNPSPSHLADHNYLSCQEKPLSERTFSRQDHFLQHISQEHKVSPGQKPLRMAELLAAWRHPLPLKKGHQALHCGFCGKTFASYKERTEHVSKHFMEGLDMMSWWSSRVSHDIPHPKPSEAMSQDPGLPHRCAFCSRVYSNLAVAQKLHPVCTMWSCSFLPGMQYTIYPAGSPEHPQTVCCYCNDTLVEGAGKVKGTILKEHIGQHNFRKCSQRVYFSGQRFRQHLQDNHKSNYDGSLFAGWTLLLKSSRRVKPAIFALVEERRGVRRAYTDPEMGVGGRGRQGEEEKEPKMNFMDLSETPLRETAPKKKLRRKASTQTVPEKLEKEKSREVEREVRDSAHFFTRAATEELANHYSNNTTGLLPQRQNHSSQPHTHKSNFPIASLPTDAINSCPRFYRRRLDASTRNRIYVADGDKDGLSKNSQRLFRKVEGGFLGGLVLHSSLLGGVPVRMTNSVDVYCLH